MNSSLNQKLIGKIAKLNANERHFLNEKTNKKLKENIFNITSQER